MSYANIKTIFYKHEAKVDQIMRAAETDAQKARAGAIFARNTFRWADKMYALTRGGK